MHVTRSKQYPKSREAADLVLHRRVERHAPGVVAAVHTRAVAQQQLRALRAGAHRVQGHLSMATCAMSSRNSVEWATLRYADRQGKIHDSRKRRGPSCRFSESGTHCPGRVAPGPRARAPRTDSRRERPEPPTTVGTQPRCAGPQGCKARAGAELRTKF